MTKQTISKQLKYMIPEVKLTLIREPGDPVQINRPIDLDPYLAPLRRAPEEYFLAFHLDVRNRVVGFREISHGTASQSLVHPREVFKAAILANASSMIVVHNHPAGSIDPSPDDIKTTVQLIAVGQLLCIPILDHLIVTATDLLSIREEQPQLFMIT